MQNEDRESICIDEKVEIMYLYPIISKDFKECAGNRSQGRLFF